MLTKGIQRKRILYIKNKISEPTECIGHESQALGKEILQSQILWLGTSRGKVGQFRNYMINIINKLKGKKSM